MSPLKLGLLVMHNRVVGPVEFEVALFAVYTSSTPVASVAKVTPQIDCILKREPILWTVMQG